MSIKKTTKRINPHIFIHQYDFIKFYAKKMKKGEGEFLREIIQFYIGNHK